MRGARVLATMTASLLLCKTPASRRTSASSKYGRTSVSRWSRLCFGLTRSEPCGGHASLGFERKRKGGSPKQSSRNTRTSRRASLGITRAVQALCLQVWLLRAWCRVHGGVASAGSQGALLLEREGDLDVTYKCLEPRVALDRGVAPVLVAALMPEYLPPFATWLCLCADDADVVPEIAECVRRERKELGMIFDVQEGVFRLDAEQFFVAMERERVPVGPSGAAFERLQAWWNATGHQFPRHARRVPDKEGRLFLQLAEVARRRIDEVVASWRRRSVRDWLQLPAWHREGHNLLAHDIPHAEGAGAFQGAAQSSAAASGSAAPASSAGAAEVSWSGGGQVSCREHEGRWVRAVSQARKTCFSGGDTWHVFLGRRHCHC